MDNNLENLLRIDTQAEKGKVVHFIKEKLKQPNKAGVVLGLRGGLDSSTSAHLLTEHWKKIEFWV